MYSHSTHLIGEMNLKDRWRSDKLWVRLWVGCVIASERCKLYAKIVRKRKETRANRTSISDSDSEYSNNWPKSQGDPGILYLNYQHFITSPLHRLSSPLTSLPLTLLSKPKRFPLLTSSFHYTPLISIYTLSKIFRPPKHLNTLSTSISLSRSVQSFNSSSRESESERLWNVWEMVRLVVS
jgi:hypothetical protein